MQAEMNKPPKRILFGHSASMVNTREVFYRPEPFSKPNERTLDTWAQIDSRVAEMKPDGMREHDAYVLADWRIVSLPNQWRNVAVFVTYSDDEPFAHAYCDVHGI